MIKIRSEAKIRLASTIERIMNDTDKFKSVALIDGLAPSCISCENFDESKELCKKFNARPPARIIALSCDSYIDNDIPF